MRRRGWRRAGRRPAPQPGAADHGADPARRLAVAPVGTSLPEMADVTESVPRTVADWTLDEKLGEGGNATVWRATGTAGEVVALKVLNSSKVAGEPYKRFLREVAFLQGVADDAGLLPLIRAELPEKPSASMKAWLAMPIATPMVEALRGAPLETVVEALGTVGATMARLHSAHGLAHRDIKPANLYQWNGKWMVGDFGLISVPNLGELTRSDRPLGPAHYTAYELIRDPAGADPFPADVYSLAKTLWVLATEQRFPPDGHQAAGARGFRIQDLRPHVHAGQLDQLVDSMTLLDPSLRPPMDQVARDLAAWLKLPEGAPALDIAELGLRFRAKKGQELAAGDQLERNKDLAMAAVRRFQELTAPIHASLRALGAEIQIDAMDDKLTNNLLRTRRVMGASRSEFLWQRCTRVMTGPRHARYTLRLGRSAELLENGQVYVRAFIDVGDPRLNGHDFMWRSPERSARAGSLELEEDLQATIAEIVQELSKAVAAFVEGA